MNIQNSAPSIEEHGRALEGEQARLWNDTPERDNNPIADALAMLLSRKWLILACALLGLVVALFITMNTTPLYRASATVQIDREAPQVLEQRGADMRAQLGMMEFYQTQYGLLKSRSLAQTVVRRLRLGDNPTLLYGYSRRGGPEGAGGNRRARDEMATGIVQRNTIVTPVRGSGLVEISFASPDPVLSARVANAFADNFIRSNLERRFSATAYARNFLQDQLQRVRARLEESERRLVQYANNQRIITVERAGNGNGPPTSQSLASINLEALNAALQAARAERIALEARTQNNSAALQRTLSDPALGALRQQRADLSGQLARLLTQFQIDYPPAQALQRQINEIDRQIAAQRGQVGQSVSADYQAAVRREAELASRVERLTADVLGYRQRSIQYNILQRESDTNRQQYDALLQRYKDVSVAGGVGINNISVVDAAQPPGAPFTPRTLMNLLIGLVIGSAAGVGIAVLLAQIDQTIRSPHELNARIGVPLLGSVPKLGNDVNVLSELDNRQSELVEAYNSVQTSLRFTTSHGAPRTLLVTS